ncbi:trypsin alpha [Bactrocera neohumeralis]|uniref:trypsin alpha-like n=1 Tax=Bactrocera tryoni TaxID=59916 RepID=UPI001A97E172|nr:trypsin alpha-like [Bactrocera tryoni]XP_050332590.1 trypsin alpha [Bactrocera neohumeralis]
MAVTRIIAFAFVLAVCVGINAAPNGRILEGNDVATGELPWVVSVRVDNAHVAVGNIIDASHILTSGHGLSALRSTAIAASRVTVRVGSINQYAGGQIVNVQSITIHPSFGNFLHDIAIITLQQPLTFSSKIAAIALATDEVNEALVEETEVALAGWGLQLSGATPYKLQVATLKVLSSHECEYQAGYGYDSVLCLEHGVNQGIATGDEGAGVVVNNTLVGVASFYFGGGGTKFPDVSSRVSYYSSWIASTIAAASED